MKHAILGPGGVGGLIGACLAKSGELVTLVVRPETLSRYPRRLHLESPYGNFEVEVDCDSKVPAADVVWITVKATQLESALASLSKSTAVGGIVPLLNGIDHVALLRSRYGADRVIPATIGVEAERVSPGHILHRSPFALLNVSSKGRPLLEKTLEQLQRMGFTCTFVDDEPTLLWRKRVFLGPLAPTTTASDKAFGEIAADPVWKRKLDSCVREACAVAQAEGAKVNPESVLSMIAGLPPLMRSSMQKDVAQGRAPELDAIAGPIVRGAHRHKITVPVTEELVAGVERAVKVKRQAS